MCGALIGAESDLESTTSQVYTSSRPSTALLGPGTASNTRPAEAVAYPNTTSHTEYAMSQRIPFPSGPAPRNSTTAGAAADNVPREDMFGVWPEMMSGGLSAYQQFQVHGHKAKKGAEAVRLQRRLTKCAYGLVTTRQWS